MCAHVIGLFQAALSLAVVLYKGLRLTQALEAALAAMASACVQKQLDATQDSAPSAAANLVFGQTATLQGEDTCMYTEATSASLMYSKVRACPGVNAEPACTSKTVFHSKYICTF